MNSSRLWLWHYHTLLSFRKGNLTDDCYELKPQPKPDNTPWQYCQAKKAVFSLISSHWGHITLSSVYSRVYHAHCGNIKGNACWLGRSKPSREESPRGLPKTCSTWQSGEGDVIDGNYNWFSISINSFLLNLFERGNQFKYTKGSTEILLLFFFTERYQISHKGTGSMDTKYLNHPKVD